MNSACTPRPRQRHVVRRLRGVDSRRRRAKSCASHVGQHDWADLLLLALESVQASPVSPAYDAVVVHEGQDLSCVGLRLLHALVGDTPDGLLLVGGGQQAVCPGGFTLVEAGVSVVGRSRVGARPQLPQRPVQRGAGGGRRAFRRPGDSRRDCLCV